MEIVRIDLGVCAGYEYAGADHGLAKIEQLPQIVDAVAAFAAKL